MDRWGGVNRLGGPNKMTKIFKGIFLKWQYLISNEISLIYVSGTLIDSIKATVKFWLGAVRQQAITWISDDESAMMPYNIARPQWVNVAVKAADGMVSRISGGWFNIKMPSYQYWNFHYGGKTFLWPSYLHNSIFYSGWITSFYWIRPHGIQQYLWCSLSV